MSRVSNSKRSSAALTSTRSLSLAAGILNTIICGAGQTTFEYDEVGRLRQATSGTHQQSFSYDENGNRTSMQSQRISMCGTVTTLWTGTAAQTLDAQELSTIGYSHNLDNGDVQPMRWAVSADLSLRFEYRVDFGTSGRSAGNPDTAWTLYATYDASVGSALLDHAVGPITTAEVPPHRYADPSPLYNPNDYARLYFRVRMEGPGHTCDWRYVRPIWVYFAD